MNHHFLFGWFMIFHIVFIVRAFHTLNGGDDFKGVPNYRWWRRGIQSKISMCQIYRSTPRWNWTNGHPVLTPRPIWKKHMIFWVSIRQLLGFRTILITWRCKLRSHRNPMAKVLWCYFPGFRRGWTVPSMFQGQTCVICTLGSTNMAGLENGPWMIEDVPSRELTYPSKMAFRRWFSFSQGGIC